MWAVRFLGWALTFAVARVLEQPGAMRYDPESYPDVDALEPQQQLADGRWTPIQNVTAMDVESGWAEVRQADGLTRRVHGSFRMVHRETGEANPPLPAPATQMPAARPPGATPTSDVVGMVNSLTQTAEALPDGNWQSSFVELAEVVGTGATEAEARAHARAQALEVGHIVAAASAAKLTEP